MRVLATAAGSFSLAVFAANCIPLLEGALLPLSCVLAALCAAALLCLRGRARVRGALICGGLALGLLWTAAYGAVFYAPARALDDRTIRLSGTVMEYPQETDYGWSVLVRADGEPGAPVPTLVYADEQGADLRPGDRVETVAHCTLAERTFGGEEITYYTAKGIFLRAEAYGELRVTAAERLPLRYLPGGAGPPAQTGGGRRLPRGCGAPDPGTDHREPGQPHRPLHLLPSANRPVPHGGGVRDAPVLPGRPGLRPAGGGKRRSALVTCGVVLVFTLISGCTPSVVRAAVMLILLQLAALLGRERDPLTALALALMLLLAWNPLFRSPYRTSALLCIGGGHPAFFRPAPGADAAGVEAAAQGLHPAPAAGGAGPLRGGGPVRHPGGHGVHHAVDGPLFREPVPDLPPG